VAVGDIAPFEQQEALLASDGADVLGPAAAWVSGADLAFGNLEAPLVPAHFEPTTVRDLPILRSLPSFARSLARLGFDVVSLANNHAYDFGAPGVETTLAALDAAQLPRVGLDFGRPAARAPQFFMRNGLQIAVIAAARRVNQPLPRDLERRPSVHRLRVEQLEAQIREVRERSNVVLVSLHWGRSYQPDPSTYQKRVASRLAAAGADLIVGHHPHVLQPVSWASGGEGVPVAYSLGNFLFGRQDGATARSIALEATFDLPPGQERAVLRSLRALPLVVNRQRRLRPPRSARHQEIFRAFWERSNALEGRPPL